MVQSTKMIVVSLMSLATIASGYLTFNGTNICCDGVVGAKTDQCCGVGQPYNTTEKVCCDSKLFDPPGGNAWNYSCCYINNKPEATKLFNIHTQVCCPEIDVFNKTNASSYYGCCKDGIYDYMTSLCCNDTTVEKSTGKLCCGNKWIYDPKTELCANSYENNTFEYKVLTKTSNNSATCGLELYDRTTQACCTGANGIRKVVPNEKGIVNPACCLEQPYDYNTRICCASGLLLNKTVTSPQIYQQCCGTQLYEFMKQVCCNNSLFDRDINSPGVCCAGKYQTVTGSRLPPICCGENFQAQSPKYEFSCCSGDNTIYNRTEKICCGDKVQNKKSPTTLCCFSNNNVYDYATEVCTNTGITRKEPEKVKGAGDGDVKGSCGPAFKLPFLYVPLNPIYYERHHDDVF